MNQIQQVKQQKKEEEQNILKYKEKIIDVCKKSLEWNYGKFDSFWNQRQFPWGYLSVSLWWSGDFIFHSTHWFGHKSKILNEYYKIIRKFALWKEVIDDNIFDALLYLKSKN